MIFFQSAELLVDKKQLRLNVDVFRYLRCYPVYVNVQRIGLQKIHFNEDVRFFPSAKAIIRDLMVWVPDGGKAWFQAAFEEKYGVSELL